MNHIRANWPNPTNPPAVISCGCGHTFAAQATIVSPDADGTTILMARTPCPNCAAREWDYFALVGAHERNLRR